MDDRRMEQVGDAAARASVSMQKGLGRASERAQDLAADAREHFADVGTSMGPWLDEARRFMRERPLQTIAITVGVGFLLGKLLGRD